MVTTRNKNRIHNTIHLLPSQRLQILILKLPLYPLYLFLFYTILERKVHITSLRRNDNGSCAGLQTLGTAGSNQRVCADDEMDLRGCVYGDEHWWCVCLVLHLAGVHTTSWSNKICRIGSQNLGVVHIKYRETFLAGYM